MVSTLLRANSVSRALFERADDMGFGGPGGFVVGMMTDGNFVCQPRGGIQQDNGRWPDGFRPRGHFWAPSCLELDSHRVCCPDDFAVHLRALLARALGLCSKGEEGELGHSWADCKSTK